MSSMNFQSLEEFLLQGEEGGYSPWLWLRLVNGTSEFGTFPFLSIADRFLEQAAWSLLIYWSYYLNTLIALAFLGPVSRHKAR